MKLPSAFFWGLIFLTTFSACRNRLGPRFDPRDTTTGLVLTNLAAVELPGKIGPDMLQPPSEPFRLGPGDRLEIELYEDPASRALVTVGPDGKIYYYLLPGLDVWGLTLPETKALLERELSAYFTDPPQVGLTLRGIESRRIWMLGRLQNAGVYPVPAPMTLLEAISMAGGTLSAPGSPEEMGDLERAFVVRNGEVLPVNLEKLLREGDMSQNIYLRPDDFVYVPSVRPRDIFVLGAVRAPRVVPMLNPMTLTAAIAGAGGTVQDAYESHVAVVRGSLSDPKVAVVDFEEIVSGKIPDIRLEPRDIVYVPFSPYRTLNKYVDLIVTTFVRAVAINEGARAVSREAAPVGVNIGIGTTIPAP